MRWANFTIRHNLLDPIGVEICHALFLMFFLLQRLPEIEGIGYETL